MVGQGVHTDRLGGKEEARSTAEELAIFAFCQTKRGYVDPTPPLESAAFQENIPSGCSPCSPSEGLSAGSPSEAALRPRDFPQALRPRLLSVRGTFRGCSQAVSVRGCLRPRDFPQRRLRHARGDSALRPRDFPRLLSVRGTFAVPPKACSWCVRQWRSAVSSPRWPLLEIQTVRVTGQCPGKSVRECPVSRTPLAPDSFFRAGSPAGAILA